MGHRTRGRIVRACAGALAVTFAAAVHAGDAPNLSTNRYTYEIDDVVVVLGQSFLDAEPVRLSVTLSDGTSADLPAPWTVLANGGAFDTSWTVEVIRSTSVVATIHADGLLSGRSANTTLTIMPPSMDFANPDWAAAAPQSYPHTGTDGGAYDDDDNGVDTRESLNGGEFACDDIVTFFLKLQADDDDDFVGPQTVQAMFEFDSTLQNGNDSVGYVAIENVSVNYGTIVDLVVGENTIDEGVDDDRQPSGGPDSGIGGSATTDVVTLDPPGGIPHVTLDNIEVTVTIDGIDRGECIVLRIDARLGCEPGVPIPNGIIKARLTDTRVIEIDGQTVNDAIPGGGNMEIPLNQTGNIEPVGACCLPDDSCQELNANVCVAQGGTPLGGGAVCVTGICVQTQACCFPNGSCQDLEPDACVTAGGIPQGPGSVCGTGTTCPQPGACCFDDGSCQVLVEAECTAAGGVDQAQGTDCTPNPCPLTGACCFADGSCMIEVLDDCDMAGGVFQGGGTICQPNPCPLGCCLTDGSCIEVIPFECLQQGGTAQATTGCDPNPCPGACCLPNGNCADGVIDETACMAQGGTFQGGGTFCNDIECPQSCCLPDGSCTLLLPAECLAQGGESQIDLSCDQLDCTPACCFPDGVCSDDLSPELCTGAGGTPGMVGDHCTEADCPSACCLPDGTCVALSFDDCMAEGGSSLDLSCDQAICTRPCCFDDGSCQVLSPDDCTAAGGMPAAQLGDDCTLQTCPQPVIACCLPDGLCTLAMPAACDAEGGTPQGPGSTCSTTVCPRGCCFSDGLCIDQTPVALCEAGMNIVLPPGTLCADFDCPEPGACCFDDGSCQDLREPECFDAGGNPLAPGSTCLFAFGNPCPQPPGGPERAHPGWNLLDNIITLTPNQPVCWSVSDGQPVGVAPFGALDPGDPPGRPDPDGGDDRVLRGYLVAIAVDQDGNEIRWNHLAGNTTVVNYGDRAAAEHNAYAHAVVADVPNGAAPDGVPGQLNLDGVEYAPAFDALRLNFATSGSGFFSGGGQQVVTGPDITLLPVSLDARQETDGPVTTKASFLVWNENEIEFSGMDRCVTCWDERLGALYDAPNYFLRENLQTDCGFARIDGVASQLCDLDFDPADGLDLGDDPRDVVSEAVPLVGVATRLIGFDGPIDSGRAAHNLHGVGTESAVIRFDPAGGSQEAQGGDDRWPASAEELIDWLGKQAGIAPNPGDTPGKGGPVADPVGPATPSGVDRVSATEKGSLLIFPKIELRWSGAAPHDLLQETFISLTNDGTQDVKVLLYFINGDPPLPAAP